MGWGPGGPLGASLRVVNAWQFQGVKGDFKDDEVWIGKVLVVHCVYTCMHVFSGVLVPKR